MKNLLTVVRKRLETEFTTEKNPEFFSEKMKLLFSSRKNPGFQGEKLKSPI